MNAGIDLDQLDKEEVLRRANERQSEVFREAILNSKFPNRQVNDVQPKPKGAPASYQQFKAGYKKAFGKLADRKAMRKLYRKFLKDQAQSSTLTSQN